MRGIRSRLGPVLLSCICACALCAADKPNAVRNGGFEDVGADRAPLHWRWGVSKEARAKMAVDGEVAHSGKRSLRLESSSPVSPHVYGGISQDLAVRPRTRYRFSVWAKGSKAGTVWMGGGPKWHTRIRLPKGDYDWREVSGEFTTGSSERRWHFRINIDSVTEAVWLDDVRVEEIRPEINNGEVTRFSPDGLASGRTVPAPLLKQAPKLDGDLSDWEASGAPALKFPQKDSVVSISDYGGAGDLSFTLRLAACGEGLLVGIDVTDDRFEQPVAEDRLWLYDSVQIALDSHCNRTSGGYDSDDREFDFALMKGRPRVNCNCPGGEAGERLARKVKLAVSPRERGMCYEMLIPWSALGLAEVGPGRLIGFNILVNDHDGDGRGYIQWTPGIGKSKNPSDFARLLIVDPDSTRPTLAVVPDMELVYDNGIVEGEVLLLPGKGMKGVRLNVRISDGKRNIPVLSKNLPVAGGGLFSIRYGAVSDKVPEGAYKVLAQVSAGADKGSASAGLTRVDARARLMAARKELSDRLADAQSLLEKARKRELPIEYPKLALSTVKLFITHIEHDVLAGEVARAQRQADGCDKLLKKAKGDLDGLLAGRLKLPAVPRYRTSKVDVVRFHFVAETLVPSTGKRERRPVFFNGYGHFGSARRTIPDFQDLGANVVQIERGPNSAIMSETETDTTSFSDYIVGGLEDGARHSVMLIPLLSPHYFPTWAHKKWPELGRVDGGFIHYAVEHPEAKKIVERYLRAVSPLMRNRPGLHSVCLSNEPIYRDTRNDPVTQIGWIDYLRRTHGNVEAMNRAWGTSYPSFVLTPIPEPKVPEDPAQRAQFYDWCRFNNERFAAWHAWMRDVIREVEPGLMCHAKVMNTHFSRGCLTFGTDAELFAQLSDLNGNDCGNCYDHNSWSESCNGTIGMNRYYDLQCSFRQAPVINTENHIIRDRDFLFIPPEHVYSALWQGAIHGQGASAVWVWERTRDPRSDFAGSILHRPLCVDAAGRAHLDLMRLSRQVVALQDVQKRVGILYSIAAMVQDDDYLKTLGAVYHALSFSGEPMRFISEQQLAQRRFGDLKLIILPNAAHVRPEALPGLREFARRGCVVAIGRENLVGDMYRRPFRPDQRKGIVRRAYTLPEEHGPLLAALLNELKSAGVEQSVLVRTAEMQLPVGVEWRAAPYEGHWVVNLFNLGRKPVKIVITKDGAPVGRAFDTTHNTSVRTPIRLAPMQVRLVEF